MMAPRSEISSSDAMRTPVVGIPRYLAGRISYATYATSVWDARFRESDVVSDTFGKAAIDIADLRERLTERGPAPDPELVTVRGVIFPCILLFPAYRERTSGARGPWIAWRDELQEWLFYGFEQWGPSWEVTHPTTSDILLGQIGRGDELESVLLVLEGELADTARQGLGDGMVVEAEVTGLLTNRGQLGDPLSAENDRWGGSFDSAVLASDRHGGHRIEILGSPDTYSAYLWQCWAPRGWIRNPDEPRVDESFFVWEHTDVTKAAALEYNLDSLTRKTEYLRERYGELILVQKSSHVVPGDAQFPTERFQELLKRRSTVETPPHI